MLIRKFLMSASVVVLALVATGGFSNFYGSTPATFIYSLGLDSEAVGKLGQSEYWLQTALRKDPQFAAAHLALGAIYIKSDRLEEAETSTYKVFETLPAAEVWGKEYGTILSMAYNNLGVIEQYRRGRAIEDGNLAVAINHWKIAAASYDSALEIDPFNALAKENRKQVNQEVSAVLSASRFR
jgi:tetratricopeptide (TPR) repeat protein